MEEITTFTLQRIAAALEEQNRFNWQWLEQNKTWHEENKERDIGPRLVAIHEENAQRDEEYRERALRRGEEMAQETNAIIQASYEAYLESLNEPSEELVQAVGEALASDMRQNGGIRKI